MMNAIIDLTKVSVNFRFELDTLDAVLLVTTSGIGYLARAAYNHFDGKEICEIELQRTNLVAVLDEAQQKGARSARIRVNRAMPVYAPSGGDVRFLAKNGDHNDIEITFG